MDKVRARALLDQERRRLDLLGRAVARDHDDAVVVSSGLEDQVDGAGRRVAEETSQALGERLRDRWGALERAEARLAAGTFGASILSGQPIPDERLEAFPLAELTVEEAAAAESGTVEEGDDAAGLASAGHPFEVLADADITPEEAQASEEDDDDEPAPEPSPGVHLERDDQTR